MHCLIFIISFSDRAGLKEVIDIQRLNQAIAKSLRYELNKTHKSPFRGDVAVHDLLMSKMNQLREISLLHMDALSRFRRLAPDIEFPALHKELFSPDC